MVKPAMYRPELLINTLTSATYKNTPSINIHMNTTSDMYRSNTAMAEQTA